MDERTIQYLCRVSTQLDLNVPKAKNITRNLREACAFSRGENRRQLRPSEDVFGKGRLCLGCFTPWSFGRYSLRLIPGKKSTKSSKNSLNRLLRKSPSRLNSFQTALLNRIKSQRDNILRLTCLECKKVTKERLSESCPVPREKTTLEIVEPLMSLTAVSDSLPKKKRKKRKKDALSGLKSSAVAQVKQCKARSLKTASLKTGQLVDGFSLENTSVGFTELNKFNSDMFGDDYRRTVEPKNRKKYTLLNCRNIVKENGSSSAVGKTKRLVGKSDSNFNTEGNIKIKSFEGVVEVSAEENSESKQDSEDELMALSNLNCDLNKVLDVTETSCSSEKVKNNSSQIVSSNFRSDTDLTNRIHLLQDNVDSVFNTNDKNVGKLVEAPNQLVSGSNFYKTASGESTNKSRSVDAYGSVRYVTTNNILCSKKNNLLSQPSLDILIKSNNCTSSNGNYVENSNKLSIDKLFEQSCKKETAESLNGNKISCNRHKNINKSDIVAKTNCPSVTCSDLLNQTKKKKSKSKKSKTKESNRHKSYHAFQEATCRNSLCVKDLLTLT